MHRNSHKNKKLVILLLFSSLIYCQKKPIELNIQVGLSIFKNQFFDYSLNKDQPHVSKALYLSMDITHKIYGFGLSLSKTYWLGISPANWHFAFSSRSFYDNVSLLRSFKLNRNDKMIQILIGYTASSEQNFISAPPLNKTKRNIFPNKFYFTRSVNVDPYTSKAISFNVRYNITRHLFIGLLANYNYIKYSNFIKLGLPFHNFQLQFFYRFYGKSDLFDNNHKINNTG
jgi:hypothetical protein